MQMETNSLGAERKVARRTNIGAMNAAAYPFALRARGSRLVTSGNDVERAFDRVNLFDEAVG